ncbi:hypothetical protein ABKV19_005521 [Rosa sericea]
MSPWTTTARSMHATLVREFDRSGDMRFVNRWNYNEIFQNPSQMAKRSLSWTSSSNTIDTLTPSQYIRDGETLVSAGGSFEQGFFSPGELKGRYLGIWYVNSNVTIVWVANRETPLHDSSGILKLTDQGDLVLLNSSNSSVWSSNSSKTAENPVSQLLDSGNLVVKDENETNPDNFLWQSFDYPSDTLLPEMKLGWNLVTGLESYVSSWKSTEDPAPGEFSVRMDLHGFPQIFLMKGAKIQSRGGSWNGFHVTGYGYPSPLEPNSPSGFQFVLNKDKVYSEYKLINRSLFSRYVLSPLGIAQRFAWVDQTHIWELSSTVLADQCDSYALCGAYTRCNINTSPICACLQGFVPKSPKDWNSGNCSNGCVRKTPLTCSEDGFLNFTRLKLPDTSSSWFDTSMSLEECKVLCSENCSCTAYANTDIRDGGSGCLLWFENLIDIKEFTPGGGQDLYIRMAASELRHTEEMNKSNKKKLAFIILSCTVFLMGLLIIGLLLYRQRKKLRDQRSLEKLQERLPWGRRGRHGVANI